MTSNHFSNTAAYSRGPGQSTAGVDRISPDTAAVSKSAVTRKRSAWALPAAAFRGNTYASGGPLRSTERNPRDGTPPNIGTQWPLLRTISNDTVHACVVTVVTVIRVPHCRTNTRHGTRFPDPGRHRPRTARQYQRPSESSRYLSCPDMHHTLTDLASGTDTRYPHRQKLVGVRQQTISCTSQPAVVRSRLRAFVVGAA